jgi:hypothetical protein
MAAVEVDLQAIVDEHLVQCGPCDFGMVEYACQCPKGDPRAAIQRLVDEVKRLRPVVVAARDLAHAMFGPDLVPIDGDDDHYSEPELALVLAARAYEAEAPDA